jgi:hypothetical protein
LVLSGLECSIEKTTILPIGIPTPIDNRILDLGFSIAEEVTILGLTIGKGSGTLNKNFSNIRNRIRNQINNWSRFQLSLPGRIVVTKTMLYSQINYLGCFIEIPNERLKEMDNLITGFVKGNINISKKRLYLQPGMGGLGLFNLETFLCAQRATWVRKAMTLDEQWKLELYYLSQGNLLNTNVHNINPNTHPTLKLIANSYEAFYSAFTRHNENFKKAFIFRNKVITRNLECRNTMGVELFGPNFYNNHKNQIHRLRYDDFYRDDNTSIDIETVIHNTGVPLSFFMLQSIRSFCCTARIKFTKKETSGKKRSMSATFLTPVQKAVDDYAKYWIT